MFGGCPTELQLDQFIHAAKPSRSIEWHLKRCEKCAAIAVRLREQAAMLADLEAALFDDISLEERSRIRDRCSAAIAGLAEENERPRED